MYDQRGRPVDGLLRVQDLYDNRANLRADVVVLSACDTTIGKDDPGEGLMSLTRGFLASGARTVVGSLYPVQEEQTLELMKGFYRELFGPDHLSPAEALRSAQLSLRNQPRFRDPHYWSAFVVTGSYGG
jgi:CHAT domain-containing protein